MTAPRDPLFWKRFSAAVHQDDLEKEERSRPELKHSYVTSPSPSPTSPSRPQDPNTPPSPPQTQDPEKATYEVQRPAPALQNTKRTSTKTSTHTHPQPQPTTTKPPPTPQRWPSTTKLPSLIRQPSKLKKPPPTSHPSSPLPTRANHARPPSHRFSLSLRHTNTSQLTLGLSGRPPSRFKFWTSITAGEGPEHSTHHDGFGNGRGYGANTEDRQSWLEAQMRKKRQRTWMCWLFWLVLLGVVAGGVVVVLLLRARGVIR